jgi:group II intron reverse transcriptase/maturase
VESKNPENKSNLKDESRGEASKVSRKGNNDSSTNQASERPNFKLELMEEVLDQSNLNEAFKRVCKNKGSAGVDGMSVNELSDYLKKNGQTIRTQLLSGNYKPMAVKRVEIPKPDGGVRLLGIPTVLDRFIQQALAQVLQNGYDKTFSNSSFGFRPNKSAHQAILKAQEYQNEGYKFVVDIDLEKFFDRVNHDKLMGKLRKDIQDKRVLKLIRAYLNAGIMDNGIVTIPEEGTPQGGPLSPLLSNIILDDMDRELEKRGHKFVRYADDCNIYVKTFRAGNRVMKSVKEFIEKRLKLKVNEKKSKVDKPAKRKFLGFSFSVWKEVTGIRIAPESIKRFKDKVRKITNSRRRIKFIDLINELKLLMIGWKNYFVIAKAQLIFRGLDEWIRRRLRSYIWQQWPKIRTRHKMLIKFGVGHDLALQTAASGKGAWRLSNSPALQHAFPIKYFDKFKLPRLYSKRF